MVDHTVSENVSFLKKKITQCAHRVLKPQLAHMYRHQPLCMVATLLPHHLPFQIWEVSHPLEIKIT